MKRTKAMRHARASIALLVAWSALIIGSVGCNDRPSTIVDVHLPPLDAGTLPPRPLDAGPGPDVYAEPALWIEVDAPAYMDAVMSLESVKLRIWGIRKTPQEVLEVARKVFSIRRPWGDVVTGSIDWGRFPPDERAFTAWSADAYWVPDAPVYQGDHVAIVDKGEAGIDDEITTREHHFFFVGAIARVRKVVLGRRPEGNFLTIDFSSAVRPFHAISALSVGVVGEAAVQFDGSEFDPQHQRSSIYVALPPTLPLDKDLHLKLDTFVGAVSGKLDGLYTGSPDSGPFELTIPKDSASVDTAYEWWPSLPLSF